MSALASLLAGAAARALAPLRAGVQAIAADPPAAELSVLQWTQPLTIAPASPIWLGIPADVWSSLRQETGSTESFAAFAARAVDELAQGIATRLQNPCAAGAGSESGPAPGSDFFRLQIEASGRPYALFAAIPKAFAELVSMQSAENPTAASVDLLLDVELPVSVSFGRAFLPVREVLRMTTGSMIELNRNVNDYVDVVVNNCVIARGEVVVIEGNYGIRVHEIVSRRERAMLQQVGRSAPLQPAVKASV